jgi:hypothetical protein
MSTISASTTSTTAYKVTADTTGTLVLQTGATPTTAVTVSSAQVVTLANALPEASGGTGTTIGYNGFKNRIINGAMVIDQRNAGASVNAPTTTGYTLDRWYVNASQSSKLTIQQNAGSVTPPAGFTYYLGATSSSAYSITASDLFYVSQFIEGYNFADLAWGTANASSVTLSFRVYSSLTGTFGGSLQNSANARSYPFTYSIPTANTWTTISITVPGDTSGTWLTTNGIGLRVFFGLGVGSTYSGTASAWAGADYRSATGSTSVVGTSGATFYITGVELEKGSTATSFDYRPIGTELALCQRYYSKSYAQGTVPATNTSTGTTSMFCSSTTTGYMVGGIVFPIIMRASPAITVYTISGTSGSITGGDTSQVLSGAAANIISDRSFSVQNNSGGTYSPTGNLIFVHWVANAEL